MNKQSLFRDPFAFIVVGAIGFILISLFGSLYENDPTPYLQGIQNDYQAGEKAKYNTTEGRRFLH